MKPLLSSAEATAADIAGGKAAALSALAAQGFDVPPFFVLTAQAFAGEALTEDARAALPAALASIGPGPFAARSSARDEDGAHHSHAGQFLSLLSLPAEAVAAAAERVWQSGAAASVQAYRATHGIATAPGEGRPAVVVQRMVDARAAGVMFTADPVSGRRDRLVISAIAGLGDRLVGGEEDGETYVVDASTAAVVSQPDGGVLTSADLNALAALAGRIEAAQGGAQDIEWAFEGERLFLLQSRPVTTQLRDRPNADPGETIFDNSNIVESYPGLVSPLTYSFAQYAYARVYRMFVGIVGVSARDIGANAAVFDNMLGRIDGRVYYNLVNWYRALALLPGFAINRSHMETMMGVGAPLPPHISDAIGPRPATGLGKVAEYGRLAKMGGLLLWRAIRLKSMVADFYRRLNDAVKTSPEAINAMPLTALGREYRRIESALLDRWDAPLVNDFLCMIAFGGSRKLIDKWAGQDGLDLHNAIMIGQGDIISAEPARRIAAMGALARGDAATIARLAAGDTTLVTADTPLGRDIRAYIAKFGDRCTEELKLESITLDEDPTQLLAAIAASAASAPSAAGHAPAPDLGAMFAGRKVKGWVMARLMRYAKARVRDRENLRFERTRIFGHARRVLLAMGRQFHANGLIDQPRDIFYLTIQEVLGAIEGFAVSHDLAGLVALRKTEMEAAAARPDPPERIAVRGAVATMAKSHAPPAIDLAASEALRKGTGCSAGIVTAVARVIADPRTQALAKGEILVSRHTDPGWIAVFSNAAAIVVERGSLLSHSAIVAREMGIPCVVGLKDATRWIRDGERIEVDGKAGTVRRIDG